jgi:hypothetical protein
VTKRVAILCPGPSLSGFTDPGEYDLLVGVNRAATVIRCDVWCACDWQLVQRERRNIIGRPRLFTNSASARRLHGRDPWLTEVEEFEWLLGGDGLPLAGTTFSAIAAVWYAVARGAKRVDVFGADMNGRLDFDGVAAGETRTETRWERERALWREAAATLMGRGVELERVICSPCM